MVSGDGHFGSEAELARYEALLQMADLMVCHHDVGELFHKLAERLHEVAAFEVASFCLHDPLKNLMQLRIWEGGELVSAPAELPMDDTTAGWVWQNQQLLAFADVQRENRFLTCLNIVKEKGIRSFCEMPLTTPQKRLGTLALGSFTPDAYHEKDLRLFQRVAELVALAKENTLTRADLDQEKQRLQMLLEVNATLVSNREVRNVFPVISGYMRKVLKHDYASVALYDGSTQSLHNYALDNCLAQELPALDTVISLKDSASGRAFLEKETKVFRYDELRAIPTVHERELLEHGIRSLCCIPLITGNGPLGTLSLASRGESTFLPHDIGLLKQIAAQLAIAVDNGRAYREIAQLKDKLAEEKRYLQGEIRTELNFEEIIGESPTLEHVLEQAKTVASSDATVLVLGETGTGKELIARAIHRMSLRKDTSFIKLNCAAIPTGLLESELFGHEKGAFTGAISQKIGRLELADKGTLFLDEVGDIPLELQPKLLRVLQDREFERLGSTRTIHVDLRLIAATNCDLEASVAEHRFRSDLYYRINVFPIHVPALREREEDIPLLVRYFVQKFSRRMNKQIESIPTEAIRALEHWAWPGNVRELENFMERSVILSEGKVLHVPLAELRSRHAHLSPEGTLLSIEREHIVRILHETSGVIAGPQGAAARLGMKRTTLQSMINRLGITSEEYES